MFLFVEEAKLNIFENFFHLWAQFICLLSIKSCGFFAGVGEFGNNAAPNIQYKLFVYWRLSIQFSQSSTKIKLEMSKSHAVLISEPENQRGKLAGELFFNHFNWFA